METLFAIYLAVLGLVIGSFLNVVIARVPEGLSVVKPRSRCPQCGHQLPWYENIPVVSWVLLRGKCSGCGKPISPRYVLVELLTGMLFLAALHRFGWTWPLVSALTFICLLIPLIFIDAEHWVLPFELTLPGIAAGLLLHLPLGWPSVKAALVGALIGFAVFRVMEFLGWLYAGTEALGAGDKFLMAMAGATLGWRPLLGIVLLSSVQGSIFGVLQIWRTGRAGPTQPNTADEAPDEVEGQGAREPFTPAFLRPGLSWLRRVALVPYTLFWQDIPDPPPLDESGQEPEWVPSKTSLPFGPWIGLAALEVMLIGPAIANAFDDTVFALSADLLFGG